MSAATSFAVVTISRKRDGQAQVRSDARPGALSAVRRALHQHRVQAGREQKSPRVEGMLAAGRQLEQLDAQTRGLLRIPTCCSGTGPTTPAPRPAPAFLAQEGTLSLEGARAATGARRHLCQERAREGHQADAPCALLYREGTRSTAGSSPPSAPSTWGRSDLIRPICGGQGERVIPGEPRGLRHPARHLPCHRQGGAGDAGRPGGHHRRCTQAGELPHP